MSEARSGSGKIEVRSVVQGNRRCGCKPRGVKVVFKETSNDWGNPNMEYLRTFLENKGYAVTEGTGVKKIPYLCLCVVKGRRQIKRDEVLAVLGENPEIDLSRIDKGDGKTKVPVTIKTEKKRGGKGIGSRILRCSVSYYRLPTPLFLRWP
jgi:hypothetical protein